MAATLLSIAHFTAARPAIGYEHLFRVTAPELQPPPAPTSRRGLASVDEHSAVHTAGEIELSLDYTAQHHSDAVHLLHPDLASLISTLRCNDTHVVARCTDAFAAMQLAERVRQGSVLTGACVHEGEGQISG